MEVACVPLRGPLKVHSELIFQGSIKGLGYKGPCTQIFQIVYTLALKYSLSRYSGPKVYTIWVHGPYGSVCWGREVLKFRIAEDLDRFQNRTQGA